MNEYFNSIELGLRYFEFYWKRYFVWTIWWTLSKFNGE